ncbi:MAG: hypothetical protein FWD05_07565 [Oscillospiraceae bacterium]|nr:hypothetical protein [Oscillospiraceae bacterium]
MSEQFDVIWRKGDGEKPEKAQHVADAAKEELLLRSLNLSTDAENSVRYNANKENLTISEYITSLVMSAVQSA